MDTMKAQSLLAQLNWRYATKKFDAAKKIPAETWAALEHAAVLAPSSFGLQPWKFVVVSSPEVRVALRAKSWNQPQITDASHLMVFARRTSVTKAEIDAYMARIAEVRGVTRESLQGFRDMMAGFIVDSPAPGFSADVWTSRQVYIALGFFLSAAAVLGVDACPMEGIDAGAYDEILGLKGSAFATTVVAAAGYRASDDATSAMKKVRFAHDAVIVRK